MMTSGRVFGGSNMTVIIPNDTLHSSTDALESLLISGSSPSFHGSRSMVNFEEISGKKLERSFYQPHDQGETFDGDLDECFHQPEKKRRLTADQVQFLERSFDIENKLEPERKTQLARDLGLQPRQVAIWFQNRRARWKTKQLEKDYDTLKASCNSLKADYENLLKEKEKLESEVILLTDKLHFKEKDLQTQRGNPETLEFGKHQSELQSQKPHQSDLQSQKPDSNSVSAVKESHWQIMVCKQEDISSANSAVFDSDSPHCTDGGHSSLMEPAVSSNILEPDQSDLSHTEEEEEDDLSKNLLPLVYNLPKLQDSIYEDLHVNSCNYGLPLEDHAFWFWP